MKKIQKINTFPGDYFPRKEAQSLNCKNKTCFSYRINVIEL